MSDITPSEIDINISPDTDNKTESPFYPNISSNRLYFHGTKYKENLDGIIKDGLHPPTTTTSDATLARRISFSAFGRYSGSNGFIIGIEPEKEEIDETDPLYAREVGINHEIENLPPERAIFYLPGSSDLPKDIFDQTSQNFNDYFESGFDNGLLMNKFSEMVKNVEGSLTKEATILKNNSSNNIHRIAQEMVWNEICSYTTSEFDRLPFEAKIVTEVREKKNISSQEQLFEAVKERARYLNFDSKRYLNKLTLLQNIGDIPGLGFDGLRYPISNQVKEVGEWMSKLQKDNNDTNKIGESIKQNRIGQLLAQLRNIRNKSDTNI